MSLIREEPSTRNADVVGAASGRVVRLSDLSADQWRSAIAAWLGWLFDGLDMHLYTLVAAPFVASLLHVADIGAADVRAKSSWIQAAFLIGWALGGGFFGRLGDRLGRSRALALTILTYAIFTGLSSAAQSWQQLLLFRFLAALGIGGEWAVGSALLAETWPTQWRAWAAAGLQTAVNIGVVIATGVTYVLAGRPRLVFLAGILPALAVFWIRRSVPEPAAWTLARDAARSDPPKPTDLFKGKIRQLTLRTVVVCATALTSWWAFMFWINQHFAALARAEQMTPTQRDHLVSLSFMLIIGVSIAGNFFAAAMARWLGYRRGIALMFVGFFLAMVGAFFKPRGSDSLLLWVPWVGFFSGVFGLFTMYLPPLFPTLLRTTGAGFSYNIGRLAAAFGTIFFGLFARVSDLRLALLANSLLLIPAMLVALTLPDLRDNVGASEHE